jgi:CRISPR-associated endonuclease/helicase Cas3
LGSRPALPDGISRDGASETDWQELAEHLGECEAEARALISAMEMEKWAAEAVVTAARWHDVGKSHEAWQRELLECTAKSGIRPPGEGLWAKFPRTQKQFRPGVRHEAASALAAWQQWRAGMQH